MKNPIQVYNYTVQNASSDALDVFIDGDIIDASSQAIMKAYFGDETSTSFKSFRDTINKSGASTFNIYINSPGGMVTDSMAIHDFIVELQAQGKTVNTKGRGVIASAATYILMSSANSEMSKNSWFMIHNASGFAYGNVDEVENQARTLRKFNDSIRDFYSNATGIRKEDISKLMNNETWMTADEAKEKGFIKSVSGEVAFTNKIAKDHWNFSDTSVLNAYNSAVKAPHQTEDNKSYFDNKLEEMKKFFTDVVNSIKGVKPAENDDKQAIVNAVADAMQAPLERVGEEIETTITNQVNAALTSEAVTNAINAAVAAAVEPFKQKVADMEADVTNKLGQPTAATNSKPATVIIEGQFSNQ